MQYAVPRARDAWELSEETMPESVVHDAAVELLKSLLDLWATRTGAFVARNLAVRWVEARPQVGVDPDVSVFREPPANPTELRSIKAWIEGHQPPAIAVEVVSETNSIKDYASAPDKYAASGTTELWVFDPLLAGPSAQGGPYRLQVWTRAADGFTRVYAGNGPAFSPELGAHLVVVESGRKLRVADDAEGARLWPTPAEERDAALTRVAELEAELRRRG